MKYAFPKGSTSVIIPVFIQDSSSTTGAGLGSLTESSNIVGGYLRPGGTGVALAVDENVATEGTYAAPTTAGQLRIGTPANMRTGTYELHLHNDLLATGADSVFITLGGATNMADIVIEIQLTTFNLNSTSNAVGVAASVSGAVGSVTGAVGSVTGSVGSVSGSVGSVAGNVDGTVILANGVHGGTSATITAKALTIIAADAGQTAVIITGNTTGHGMSVSGGANGIGIQALGGTSGGAGISASAPVGDDISGDINGSIASIADDGITATSMAAGSISAGTIHADELTNIEDEIWDAGEIDHNAADTMGKNLRTAGEQVISILTNIAALNDLGVSDLRTVFGINGSNALDELAQGAPATNPSLGAAIMANYMALVQKYVVDSSANFKEVHNAAGTKIFKKALTDAASVFTEAKAVTGA